MSGLWLRYAFRQLLRTLGQNRAILPLLVIGCLTLPTAIVAVNEMAPGAAKLFRRLGSGAAEKTCYACFLGLVVLLFPLQIHLIHELDSSPEIENLERYPMRRRSIFHFKLVDQGAMVLPLLLLVLVVTCLGGLYRPLLPRSQVALVGGLLAMAAWVQLSTLFAVTGALGLLPRGAVASRGALAGLLLASVLGALVLVAALYPYRLEQRWSPLPWVAVPALVRLVELGHLREAAVPAFVLALQVLLAYALAGWSYHRHLLVRREELAARLAVLAGRGQPLAGGPGGGGGIERLLPWPAPIPLLVEKDVKLMLRPPANRVILVLLGVPFGFLLLFVGAGLALGAPNPFLASHITLYGRAVMLLALYAALTLFWIPCAQIFLFSYEHWPLTLTWFGPFQDEEVRKAKSVAAGVVVLPAVGGAYLGLALALAASGGPGTLPLLAVGAAFVGTSTWLFGSLVSSLGILFPYYLQTRYRHLSGGLGFLMQLSLVPAWAATWLLGVVCANLFGWPGAAALAGALLLWAGFARVLAFEARHAIGKIRVEIGRTAASG